LFGNVSDFLLLCGVGGCADEMLGVETGRIQLIFPRGIPVSSVLVALTSHAKSEKTILGYIL
jgi:hypothetical protein